jgi:hypothetical protein
MGSMIETLVETHFSHGLTSLGLLVVLAAIAAVVVFALIVLAVLSGRKE